MDAMIPTQLIVNKSAARNEFHLFFHSDTPPTSFFQMLCPFLAAFISFDLAVLRYPVSPRKIREGVRGGKFLFCKQSMPFSRHFNECFSTK